MLARFIAVILALQAPQTADTPLTIEGYRELKRLSDVQVSPGAATVAFTMRDVETEVDGYRTDVYVWSNGAARSVTPGLSGAHSPRWSPDGTTLCFLAPGRSATGQGTAQLWAIRSTSGAAPSQLSELPGGVLEYGWAPDGLVWALSSEDDGSRGFWRIGAADGATEYVWGGDPGIREMAVSPDGGSIVFSTNGTGAPEDYHGYNLRILDVDARRSRELTSRLGSEVAPAWSPDGRSVAFRAPQNPSVPYSQSDLFVVDVARRTLDNLSNSFDRTILDHRWPSGGDIIFTAAVGFDTHLFAVRRNGSIELVSGGEITVGDFDAEATGATFYFVHESPTEAAELRRIDGSGSETLTSLNQLAHRWLLARQEVVRWQSPDGLTVEGLLVYPARYEEGRRYPLLVDADAGPLSRARNVLDQPSFYQLFAAHGYAVLAVNYRGSSGYGEGFGTARKADLAGGDLVDLLTGVDHVIDLGVADSTRLAIFGGSRNAFGAYLSTWAITQTRRFQAATAIYGAASPSSPSSAHTMTPERALVSGGYLELLERERSPLDSIRSVRTPLLVFERDTQTLISRSRRLYNALSELGRTAQHVAVAGGAAAAPALGDRTDLFFRQLRWFDRYLKFAGADLFDFYLVGEWVPGPGGWQLRVESAEQRSDYSGLRPESGQYLEITLTLEPSATAVRDGSLQDFELDPESAVSLIGPDSRLRPFAGTVTQLFGSETLVMGLPSAIRVTATGPDGAPTALGTRLAFEISETAAEYRLSVTGFVPIRIWVAGND